MIGQSSFSFGRFLNTELRNTGVLSRIGDAGLAPWRAMFGGKTYHLVVEQDQILDIFNSQQEFKNSPPPNNEKFTKEVRLINEPPNKILIIAMVITGLFLVLPLFKLLAACFADVRLYHTDVQRETPQLLSVLSN